VEIMRIAVVVGFLVALSQCAGAAIITASGSKTAKTSGMARVVTTTKGQRQILITIDPGVATAFRLDVAYPMDLVTLAGFDGINPFATDEGVTLVPPYTGGVGGGATILPKFAGLKVGLINDVEGRYPLVAAPPVPNRADGNSDLFTLSFIDLAPEQDKVFTVLGLDAKGIDPDFARLISDNYLDVYDSETGQIVHYDGEQIEAATIIVPGIAGGGPGAVPSPAGVWVGLMCCGAAVPAAWYLRRCGAAVPAA
jgi:hypothetical protein